MVKVEAVTPETVTANGVTVRLYDVYSAAWQSDDCLRRKYLGIVRDIMDLVAAGDGWCQLLPYDGAAQRPDWSGTWTPDADEARRAWSEWRSRHARWREADRRRVEEWRVAMEQEYERDVAARRRLLREYGADRIVYGTPVPYMATVYRNGRPVAYVRT